MMGRIINENVKDYQNTITESLQGIFGQGNVKKEWDVTKDSQDAFDRQAGLYRPRIDIAVGPFNIDGNVERNIKEIDNVVNDRKGLIESILRLSKTEHKSINEFLLNKNQNPRCFLAIEIEKSGTRKHMLGNIANVSIIGYIGIVIPFDEKQLCAAKRIEKYLDFVSKARKTKSVFKNVLIIGKNDFIKCIEPYQGRWGC